MCEHDQSIHPKEDYNTILALMIIAIIGSVIFLFVVCLRHKRVVKMKIPKERIVASFVGGLAATLIIIAVIVFAVRLPKDESLSDFGEMKMCLV